MDLRVCSFSEHINNVVAKAKQRTSVGYWVFSVKILLLTEAFTVYVRPTLEYCSSIWSPCYIGLGKINKLESVQRMFTKKINWKGQFIISRLNALGLERLELRRLGMDLITCYNTVHGRVNIPFDSLLGRLLPIRPNSGSQMSVRPSTKFLRFQWNLVCR